MRRRENARGRRRSRRPPLPQVYADVGEGERLRWHMGHVLIEGDVKLVQGAPPPVIWPDWSGWASVYKRCRDDFLTDVRRRDPDRVPGAERLFLALRAEGRAGAERMAEELRDEERNDPRRRAIAR